MSYSWIARPKSLPAGHNALKAGTAEKSLKLFHQHKDQIFIVVAEFYMLHGLKIIKTIEQERPDLNIVTCSGVVIHSCEFGCDYCQENLRRKRLLKPFKADDLVKSVNDFEHFECQAKHQCVSRSKKDEDNL